MSKPTFGWVIQPAGREPEDAGKLMDANLNFIERGKGVFDTIWVEDHFQWEDRPTLECWTAISYLAPQFPDHALGTLVLGQSYRNPAITAKMFATLQWLSGGRLIAGIGAGWKEDEYDSYGWPYPEPRIRIGQLEDTVNIIRQMWRSSPATFEGEYYAIKDAYCEPMPHPEPPLLIGGGGEQLTLKVVARYADWMNVGFRDVEEYSHKLDILKDHCEAVGSDYSAIKKTYFGVTALSEDGAKPENMGSFHYVLGTPDQVTAELQSFIDVGVEHFILRFTDFPDTTGIDLFMSEVYPRLTAARA